MAWWKCGPGMGLFCRVRMCVAWNVFGDQWFCRIAFCLTRMVVRCFNGKVFDDCVLMVFLFCCLVQVQCKIHDV